MISPEDLEALWLTIQLAFAVTVLLLMLSTPIAWWLSRTSSPLKPWIEATVALPLILPPSVLGFYLLMAMGPEGPLGRLTQGLGLGLLPFTFQGLVLTSVIYSLPFVVQPLTASFESIPSRLLEAAATLRACPFDRFIHVVLPLSRAGFLSSAVLGFAHTMGEFGVVLMIGGNIEGETRLASIQIFDHVEALEYDKAHGLSAILLFFSFVSLLMIFRLNRVRQGSVGR